MHALHELIPKARDQDGRSELSNVYNSKLARFGSDPLGKSQELLDELQQQLTEFGSTRQTSDAIKSLDGKPKPAAAAHLGALYWRDETRVCVAHTN